MDKITVTIDRAEAYLILQALDLLEDKLPIFPADKARREYQAAARQTADALATKIRKAYNEP